MSGINKCLFIGNLTRDPEVRYSQSGQAVVSFAIACNETWKDKEGQKQERVEFVNITAFGKLGEICEKYLQKGKQVYIEGRMQTDKYEKDGRDVYSTKIIASQMTMLRQKEQGQTDNSNQGGNPGGREDFECPRCHRKECDC